MEKRNLLLMLCLFMAMLCSTTVTSCSDDDEDTSPNALIGKWKSVSATMDGFSFSYDDQMYMTIDITSTTMTTKSFTNGVEETSETESFSYKVKGNKIVSDGQENEFVLEGDKLTITFVDEEGTMIIVFKRQ